MIEALSKEISYKFDYSIIDLNEHSLIQEQRNLLRTQCIDATDKSNITQYKIAMESLLIM